MEAVTPERAALPITETGYRSNFLHPTRLDAAGGAVAYVLAWVNEAAQGKDWQEQEAPTRQLSLL